MTGAELNAGGLGGADGAERSALEWFVYYRVAWKNQRLALDLVLQFQADLRLQWPGLQARVMQRAPARAGEPEAEHLTLMETYAWASGAPSAQRYSAVPPEFGACLHAGPTGLAALLEAPGPGARHMECFLPCA